MQSIIERLKDLANTLDKVQNELGKESELYNELYDQRCELQSIMEDIAGEEITE